MKEFSFSKSRTAPWLISFLFWLSCPGFVHAAKTCAQVEGDEYPCCCVIGGTGTCESSENCTEIGGKGVSENEHFRCTAGVKQTHLSALGVQKSLRESSLVLAQTVVPQPLSNRVTPEEGRRREGCPRSTTRKRALACTQYSNRSPKQSEVALADGSVEIHEKMCYSLWFACTYEFPDDYVAPGLWITNRDRIGRGNSLPQDDFCLVAASSVRNETIVRDESARAECLKDHGCTYTTTESGTRIGAVQCPTVDIERKKDLVLKVQERSANLGSNRVVTRIVPLKAIEVSGSQRTPNAPDKVTPTKREPTAGAAIAPISTRIQVNKSSIFIFAKNPRNSSAQCSIQLVFTHNDFGDRKRVPINQQADLTPGFDGVMVKIAGAYVDIELVDKPNISCH